MSESPRASFTLRDLFTQIRRRLRWPPIKPPVVVLDRDPHAAERLEAQIQVIRDAFAEAFGDADVPFGATKGARRSTEDDLDFLYHPRRVLVRDGDDYELLRQFFADPGRREDFLGEHRRLNEPARDLPLHVEVPLRRDGEDPVLRTLVEIDRAHPDRRARRRPIAQPDHIVYVTLGGRLCPFTEPEEPLAIELVPPMTSNADAGSGVRISVVDTGLWLQATKSDDTKWLEGVTVGDPQDEEVVKTTNIHKYAGHGTFVAGIVRCLAPKSEISVEGALPYGGAVYESRLVEEMREALRRKSDPQIISISAGTHTRDCLGLLGLEILAEAHGLTDGTKGIVVAAAGNDSSDQEFYPAAYPWVIAVGALDERGNVASYSNYGPWVDVWARGSNLVNAFPEGTYYCYEPPNKGQPRDFKFLARWSGTSFATPIVTGAVAAQMSSTGNTTDPQKAFNQVQAVAAVCKDPKAGGGKHLGPL